MKEIFFVNYPDYHGDNWREYEGHDAEDAAKNFGRSYNENGDYTLMNKSIFVRVREGTDGLIRLFAVSAEPDIYYSSQEMSEPVLCQQCNQDSLPKLISGEMSELFDDRFCSFDCYKAWVSTYQQELEARRKEPK